MPTGPCREVKLLSNYHRDMVKQRKRVVSRLRWQLHELDPALQIPPRGLRRYCVTDALPERRDAREGVVARLAASCGAAAAT